MCKLKIKNFGPIRDGLKENSGFLEIKDTTIFIGNQATGKSSIVKLYATLVWLEKTLYRGDITEKSIVQYNRFRNKYCEYQGLKNYFLTNTYIEYIGDVYSFVYKDEKLSIKREENKDFLAPQIMYVPAERNFLSVVDTPEKLKGLPKSLYTFLEEFEKAQKKQSNNIQLPINNISFEFQKQNKISYIIGKNYKIRLAEASSGIQSLLPIYLVSKNLSESIDGKNDVSKESLSRKKQKKLQEEVAKILSNDKLSEEVKEASYQLLSSMYTNACFINIVEELEQNLFPTSQKNLLFSLFKFLNQTEGNKLILTTHSPYIINYLTLAIKAEQILKKISNNSILLEDLEKVISKESCIDGRTSIVYELTENGIIKILPTYHDMPSDENYLNIKLDETNDLFYQLLEIEDKIESKNKNEIKSRDN